MGRKTRRKRLAGLTSQENKAPIEAEVEDSPIIFYPVRPCWKCVCHMVTTGSEHACRCQEGEYLLDTVQGSYWRKYLHANL